MIISMKLLIIYDNICSHHIGHYLHILTIYYKYKLMYKQYVKYYFYYYYTPIWDKNCILLAQIFLCSVPGKIKLI